MRKMWLPVRCCCGPAKIFGFLRMEAVEDLNSLTSVHVVDYKGHHHKLRVEISRDKIKSEAVPFADGREVTTTRWTTELAVFSEDRPLEFWHTIPEFVEAPMASGGPRRGDGCTIPGCCRRGVPGNENIIAGRLVCDYCHAAGLHPFPAQT